MTRRRQVYVLQPVGGTDIITMPPQPDPYRIIAASVAPDWAGTAGGPLAVELRVNAGGVATILSLVSTYMTQSWNGRITWAEGLVPFVAQAAATSLFFEEQPLPRGLIIDSSMTVTWRAVSPNTVEANDVIAVPTVLIETL